LIEVNARAAPCDALDRNQHDLSVLSGQFTQSQYDNGEEVMNKWLRAALCAACVVAAPAIANAASNGEGIYQGDILARVRGISIQPNIGQSDAMSSLGVQVNNAIVPELDFTYMIRDAIGVELILGTSRHQLTSTALGNLGGVNVLPPTLLLQYHFNHAGKIRPYLGAGLNYTYFYNDGLHVGDQGIQVTRSSFGPALQAGVDVQVAKNLFVNLDVKKIWMRTNATLGDTNLGTLHIDPVIVGVGVGMKF
jgi:outer membrane protein